MPDWLRTIGEWAYRHEVAGLFGALTSARWAPAGASKWAVATGVICAWFAAVYLTDPVIAWLQLGGMRGVQYGMAFLIGLFSLNLGGAARVHGTVHALFLGRRRSDDAPEADE